MFSIFIDLIHLESDYKNVTAWTRVWGIQSNEILCNLHFVELWEITLNWNFTDGTSILNIPDSDGRLIP